MGWVTGPTTLCSFRGQFEFEGGCLRRGLLRVALAGHLQLAAQPVQELAHSTLGQGSSRAFLDPRLRVVRPTKLPFRQPRQELRLPRSAHDRKVAGRLAAPQQLRHAASHYLVPIREHRLSRHVGHARDLRTVSSCCAIKRTTQSRRRAQSG